MDWAVDRVLTQLHPSPRLRANPFVTWMLDSAICEASFGRLQSLTIGSNRPTPPGHDRQILAKSGPSAKLAFRLKSELLRTDIFVKKLHSMSPKNQSELLTKTWLGLGKFYLPFLQF